MIVLLSPSVWTRICGFSESVEWMSRPFWPSESPLRIRCYMNVPAFLCDLVFFSLAAFNIMSYFVLDIWCFDCYILWGISFLLLLYLLFCTLHVSWSSLDWGNYHVFFCLKYFLFLSPVFLFPLFTHVLFTGFVFSHILCFLRCLGSRFFQILHFVWLFSVYVPFWT